MSSSRLALEQCLNAVGCDCVQHTFLAWRARQRSHVTGVTFSQSFYQRWGEIEAEGLEEIGYLLWLYEPCMEKLFSPYDSAREASNAEWIEDVLIFLDEKYRLGVRRYRMEDGRDRNTMSFMSVTAYFALQWIVRQCCRLVHAHGRARLGNAWQSSADCKGRCTDISSSVEIPDSKEGSLESLSPKL